MKLRMEMNPLALLLLALLILLLLPERTAEPRTFIVREESEFEKRRRKQAQTRQAPGTSKKRPWETAAAMKQRHNSEIENVIDGVYRQMEDVVNG